MSSDVDWHAVVTLDEFWEGELYDTEIGDDQVLLVHLPGAQIKAYQGLCPHQEVLLVDGEARALRKEPLTDASHVRNALARCTGAR